MEKFLAKLDKKQFLRVLLTFLLGMVFLIAVRFVSYEDSSVHFHANFAVFVNNERLAFDNFTFYEEVQSCAGNDLNNPKIRVHMHDKVNNVVHVHDNAATWGHFFANLGMTAGDNLFKTVDEVFVENQDDIEIRYLLNGEEVQTIANRAISSEDVLLISIGSPTDEKLQKQFSEITNDAGEYNKRADPSACTGGKEPTFLERLKASTGIF